MGQGGVIEWGTGWGGEGGCCVGQRVVGDGEDCVRWGGGSMWGIGGVVWGRGGMCGG